MRLLTSNNAIDALVLQQLDEDPTPPFRNSLPAIALKCGISFAELRASMRRLALRMPGDDPRWGGEA